MDQRRAARFWQASRLGLTFDFILLSAVWMHIPESNRARAFRKVITLLKPGGVIAMSLRQGPADSDRGMHPIVRAGNMDVLAVHEAVREAARLAREERQPSMIEARAYRYRGHSMSDPDTTRAAEEKERWQARDPLVTFERILLGEGVMTRDEIDEVRERVAGVVEEAVAFAEASPAVEEDELARHVYANPWNDDPRGSALMP